MLPGAVGADDGTSASIMASGGSMDEAVPAFEQQLTGLLARTPDLREEARFGVRTAADIIDDAGRVFISNLRAVKFAAAASGNTSARNAADAAIARVEGRMKALKEEAAGRRATPEAAVGRLMTSMQVRAWALAMCC